MADTQPKHWDRSFEWVFYILLAIVALFVFATVAPSILEIVVLVLIAAIYLIPVALVGVIGYSLWRLCFRRG
jgi:uncharacterized membrane protein YgcG